MDAAVRNFVVTCCGRSGLAPQGMMRPNLDIGDIWRRQELYILPSCDRIWNKVPNVALEQDPINVMIWCRWAQEIQDLLSGLQPSFYGLVQQSCRNQSLLFSCFFHCFPWQYLWLSIQQSTAQWSYSPWNCQFGGTPKSDKMVSKTRPDDHPCLDPVLGFHARCSERQSWSGLGI